MTNACSVRSAFVYIVRQRKGRTGNLQRPEPARDLEGRPFYDGDWDSVVEIETLSQFPELPDNTLVYK